MMAAGRRLRPSLLLLGCSVITVAHAQTPWPPPTLSAVDPTTASGAQSRQFLSEEEHQLLTSPSFGQRLTSRPRPATRRDWTPIWPGTQPADSGGTGGASAATVAQSGRPSRRPETVTAPSLAPSRPPVTEYYFASSATPAGDSNSAGPAFPPAQLPTATFAAPAATPTRGLPPAGTWRPTVTRLGLADRLSALVTSRPAQTTVIAPTRAGAGPGSSAVLRPTPQPEAGTGELGLEPSTGEPWQPEPSPPAAEPTAAAPAAASSTELSPTPVSPPCIVTPQPPGGYCRDGDILTVFTRGPTGAWEAYRTVQLPSSTVAALDGRTEEETTPDPAAGSAGSQQTTEREGEGATVTSLPAEAPTPETVPPISAPEEETGSDGASGARDHLPSVGPTLPTAGPSLPTAGPSLPTAGPSLPTAGSSLPTAVGPTLPSELTEPDELDPATAEVSVVFPTATSAEPAPQPPTVGPGAGAGAVGVSAATAPPTASEGEKSGGAEPSDAPEEEKVTTLPSPGLTSPQTSLWGSSPTARPQTWPPTEPPTAQTTGQTAWETQPTAGQQTFPTTRQTFPTTRQTFPTIPQTFPTTLETFPTTPETFPTTSQRAAPAQDQPTPTTPPPNWPLTQSPAPTPSPTAPSEPTAPGDDTTPGGVTAPSEGSTEQAWGAAPSAAPSGGAWSTLPPGAHPETTQQAGSKSAELGKVSVSRPTPTGGGQSPGGGGFSTGTYHFSTTGTFDYPTGPTGAAPANSAYPAGPTGAAPASSAYPAGPTGAAPASGGSLAAGSTGFPSTTQGFHPTAPSGPVDYDYTTELSGAAGGGFQPGNYSTIGHGRLTPPPPPPVTTGTTGVTSGTGVTSTGEPGTTDTTVDTTVGTTPEATPGSTPGTTAGTTPGTTAGTSPAPGITHSSVVPPVEVYVQFLVGTTWPRFCRLRQAFKQRVVDLVNRDTGGHLSADSAVLFNIPVCGRPVRSRRETDPAILVFLYVTDSSGQYSRQLTERVEPLWEAAAAGGGGGGGGMARLVREVDTVRPEQLVRAEEGAERAGVIAAITVGCVAVASLVLLAVLLVVVRQRRRAARAAQRCNPVSLEEYGVESVFSSLRRKNKLRRSVRSYLNQAFDDQDAPSNAVNFAGLANLSGDLAALKEEFDSIPTGAMPTLDDLPLGSEDRNRYANVLPVPETRVVLELKTGAPNSDYINANYVRGPKEEPQFYIATQGPLESTVNDFWRMVWETQCKVVVCLTDIVERGVRRCAEYLPPSEALDRHRLYGDFQVTLMAKTKKDKFVVSTVQLKNMDSNLFREVTHLWYSGWPERGVPSDLDSLVEFLQETRRAMKTNIGPTVVHCSPGTGRTGVLLACDLCMRQFDASRTADIMRTVFRIRQDRAGAVQTREQYALIYKVLNQYAASVTSGNLPALE